MIKNSLVVLVTGANRGIGFEVVRQLARLGHAVFLGARDNEKGIAAIASLKREGLTATFVQLDVADTLSVETAAATMQQTVAGVDVIINNAAVLLREDQSLSAGTAEVFHKTMRTNVFGPPRLFTKWVDLTKKSWLII